MTCRRVVVSGAVIVGVYLAALAATVLIRDSHVRPLYDGFAPPTPYSWVDPPGFFRSGNDKPEATSAVVRLGPNGSDAAGIGSPDGQFVIDLARGAIAPHVSDRQIEVAITPVDPKQLAPVPLPLRANGNVYHVTMTYEPSGTNVTAVAKPGTMLIQVPEVGNNLFRSVTGRSWVPLPSTAMGNARTLSFSATFDRPGYYVGATDLPERAGPSSRTSRHSLALGAGVALLALLVLFAGFVAARRTRRRPPPARPAARSPRRPATR